MNSGRSILPGARSSFVSAGVAQRLERRSPKPLVAGSNPVAGANLQHGCVSNDQPFSFLSSLFNQFSDFFHIYSLVIFFNIDFTLSYKPLF